jgi:pyruvate dehydrogenase E2 component (dihydrolipoamide acetyltransferase)
MSERVFSLPDLGEGLTEAEIVTWNVAVGDRVEIDQPVAEVETAKAAVEVPCPYAGVVSTLHGEPGDVVSVGSPLITIGADISVPAQSNGVRVDDKTSTARDEYEQHREEERAGSGNVLIGYGTGHGGGRRRRARVADHAGKWEQGAVRQDSRTPVPRVLSPVVRKLARERGVDLTRLDGTGNSGVILRKDVEAAIAGTSSASAATAEETRIPLRGLRGAVAEKLARSHREIPDATTWVDLDATELLTAKDALKAVAPSIGLLAVLARLCVAGLERFPELNATVDTGRGEIVQFGRIHLGFAAQTPRGLVVPVVHDAHAMSTAELGEAIVELTGRAREGKLAPEQMSGGTFTLNNYGVFGVDGSTPIINHPEAAILGVGRIVDKPWAHVGELALRKVTQMSLTFDHRVCDGGTAGGFLRYVGDCVENPVTLLAHV